jgi:creatinine amidohydrolase
MRWEELTGDLFPKAVKRAGGVCLLPLSCIERHGHHLPLGTDMYIAREICRRASDLEPAVVFPDLIFTQILEARHYPGCIGLEPELTVRLLEGICAEIGRNGLEKIVIVNGHGGNEHLIHYFSQIQLAAPRRYVVYVAEPPYHSEEQATRLQWETEVDGHAGERETSAILAIRPDLIRKEALRSGKEGMPLGRLKKLRDRGVYTGIWWYADHPTHYCGDGRYGKVEKGERWLNDRARALAEAIRAIKADKTARRLQDEFFRKIG